MPHQIVPTRLSHLIQDDQRISNTTDQPIIVKTTRSEESRQQDPNRFVDDFVETVMHQGQIRQHLWDNINEISPISKQESRR